MPGSGAAITAPGNLLQVKVPGKKGTGLCDGVIGGLQVSCTEKSGNFSGPDTTAGYPHDAGRPVRTVDTQPLSPGIRQRDPGFRAMG